MPRETGGRAFVNLGTAAQDSCCWSGSMWRTTMPSSLAS